MKQWKPTLKWLMDRGIDGNEWLRMSRKERHAVMIRERKKLRKRGKNSRVRRIGIR